MSDKESAGTTGGNPSKASSNDSDSSSNSFQLPSIKESVRLAVDVTNRRLVELETSVSSLKQPLSQTWTTVKETGTAAVKQMSVWYDHRLEYGPAIVAGTAVTTSAVTALRRGGRILPTTVSALVGGGIAYGVVYGALDEVRLPSTWTDVFKRD